MDSDLQDAIPSPPPEDMNWVVSLFDVISNTRTEIVVIIAGVLIFAISKLADVYMKKSKNDANENGSEGSGDGSTIPISAFLTLVKEREVEADKVDGTVESIQKTLKLQEQIDEIHNDLLQIKEQLDEIHRQTEYQAVEKTPDKNTSS